MTSKKSNVNINVFGKYDVLRQGEYSYIDEYGDIAKAKYKHLDRVNADMLIKFIKDIMDDPYLIEVHFIDNKIYYSTFNCFDGTGEDMTLTITEIHNGQKANK